MTNTIVVFAAVVGSGLMYGLCRKAGHGVVRSLLHAILTEASVLLGLLAA